VVTPTDETPRVYALKEGVRVFRSGEEIRFRKGVWNYNEAVVRLAGHDERIVRFFGAVYEALAQAREVDPAAIALEIGASGEDLASYRDFLESLRAQQFLHDTQERDVTRTISALLGGSFAGFEERVGTPRPVLFFADSDYALGAARSLAKETGLPLDILDGETLQALAAADLTTRTDAIQYMEAVSKLEKIFHPYSCVIGSVASPNLSLLRNLNRLLVRAEKPLILGLIDGPFVSVLSTLATETGCYECFEQRMLARLEDTVVYHEFVKAAAGRSPVAGPWSSPQLHILTAAVISEGYLYSTIGMLRLAGRIVNIYLPLLEIQVQDLLRVPYCPACGFISKSRMNEMYTSSKRLVTDMLAKIKVEG
jgi:thiazole/oxazole-forming peptide maturase SagC family component